MDSGQDLANPRRRILKEVVCVLLVEAGFDSAADECIETLLELMTSCKLIFILNIIVYSYYNF